MSNQIIYSLVVRKKNTILCEYSEHSGNFQQIALKIIRKALSVQLNIFRSVVKYDDYIFYILSINNIFLLSLTDNPNKDNPDTPLVENPSYFIFLKYLYDKLLKEKSLEDILKAEAFSLVEFVSTMKLSATAYNIKPETFNDPLNEEEFPLSDIDYKKQNTESRLSIIKNVTPILDSNENEYDEIIEKIKEENDTKSELMKDLNQALIRNKGSIKKKKKKKWNKKYFILIVSSSVICVLLILFLLYEFVLKK